VGALNDVAAVSNFLECAHYNAYHHLELSHAVKTLAYANLQTRILIISSSRLYDSLSVKMTNSNALNKLVATTI